MGDEWMIDGRMDDDRQLSGSVSSLSTKPSVEEMRLWSQSFDKLMRNPAGRNVFREFLRTEYSEENMLFWLACEDLKQEVNKNAIQQKARCIYDDYVSILSPKEVRRDLQAGRSAAVAAFSSVVLISLNELVSNRELYLETPLKFHQHQVKLFTHTHSCVLFLTLCAHTRI